MPRNSMHRARKPPIAPAPRAPTRSVPDMPTSGYALIVDGQLKGEFKTKDAAEARGKELKLRFPFLQIRVFDAQEKRSETIEPATPHQA